MFSRVARPFVFVVSVSAMIALAYAHQAPLPHAHLTIAHAQTVNGSNVTGWAWSDNVGWISFDCDGATGKTADGVSCGPVSYGVTLAPDNTTLQGYAWSDHVGWISFKSSDLAGCPNGNCTARVVSGALQGWARACDGSAGGNCALPTSRTDGWDGWISLSGSAPTYGPKVLAGSGILTGFAWGSDVMGWIDFTPTLTSFADCTLVSANPNPTAGATTITFTPNDYVKSGYLTGSVDTARVSTTTSTTALVVPSATQNYTMTVADQGGRTATCGPLAITSSQPNLNIYANGKKGTVAVTPNTSATITWNTANITAGTCSVISPLDGIAWFGDNNNVGKLTPPINATRTYTLRCNGSLSTSVTLTVSMVGTLSALTANPTRVRAGQTSTLSWSTTNITACGITGSDGSTLVAANTPISNGTHSKQTNAINATTIYTLSCTDNSGGTFSQQATVQITPSFHEQ